MKSKITNFHTFWSSPSLQAGLQNPHERRAYTLLAEVLVFHGKFVRLSSEAGRLHFTLRGAAMFSSNILRPGKKLKRKQTRTKKLTPLASRVPEEESQHICKFC